jgi:glycosyltransferase involved in cell wall biosynthesis
MGPFVDAAPPVVAIVVATKNARDALNVLLADFAGLRSLPLELIVADGGSLDGTAELLTTTATGLPANSLKWLSQPDSGLAEAWNRAILLATAPWLVFAGADDRLGNTAAWKDLLDWLPHCPQSFALIGLAVQVVAPSGNVIGRMPPNPGPNNRRIFAVNSLPHQGLFHARSLFSRLGDFDHGFRVAADYEYTLRALKSGYEVLVQPGKLCPVRMTFGGMSTHDPLANVLEFRKAQLKHGIRRPGLDWWTAWARAAMRAIALPLLGQPCCGRIANAIRLLRGLPPAWNVR